MNSQGGEIGPFLAIEQSSLTESVVDHSQIPKLFGYYQLVGFIAQALGSLVSGFTLMSLQQTHGWSPLAAYRFVIVGYAVFGLLKFGLYFFLSPDIEPLHSRDANALAPADWMGRFGLHRPESKRIVAKLSALFGALFAFAILLQGSATLFLNSCQR